MRELFDRLLAEGEAGIDRLVAERTQESVTLDFKKKVDASTGKPDDQDKRVLAKAMSAFSNSGGGVIVYGVHGVPGSDGVDCAQATRPIAEIDRFVSALHELSGELLQPRHSGIQVGIVRSDRTEGAGYAVVHVERSERRPHRSEAKDQKQYFKRGGSKSYAMEHFDIEDAFRRYDVAKLSLEWALNRTHTDGNDDLFFQVTFWLHNTSRVTAHRPYLKIRNARGFDPMAAKVLTFTAVADRNWTCFECGSDTVIHPDRTLTALSVREDIRRYPGGQVTVRRYPSGPFLRFDYGIGCENSAVEEGSISLSVEDLHEQAETEYRAMLVERAPRPR